MVMFELPYRHLPSQSAMDDFGAGWTSTASRGQPASRDIALATDEAAQTNPEPSRRRRQSPCRRARRRPCFGTLRPLRDNRRACRCRNRSECAPAFRSQRRAAGWRGRISIVAVHDSLAARAPARSAARSNKFAPARCSTHHMLRTSRASSDIRLWSHGGSQTTLQLAWPTPARSPPRSRPSAAIRPPTGSSAWSASCRPSPSGRPRCRPCRSGQARRCRPGFPGRRRSSAPPRCRRSGG